MLIKLTQRIALSILLIAMSCSAIPGISYAAVLNTSLYGDMSVSSARPVVAVINKAHKGDTVVLAVNSPGGDLNSALMILSAIKHSPAIVIAEVRGKAASAAAFVVIGCRKVSGTGEVLFHTGNVVIFGRVFPPDRYQINLTLSLAKKVLNKSELDRMKRGQDVILSVQEVSKRMR